MVEFYTLSLSPDESTATLTNTAWLNSDDSSEDDYLTLSLAWHPTRHDIMATTASDGSVSFNETTGDFAEINHNMSTSKPLRHELEAWTVAFAGDGKGIFSGGDDCVVQFMELTET